MRLRSWISGLAILAASTTAPATAQVEYSLTLGAGMSYGSVADYRICGRAASPVASRTDADGTLHGGLDLGSRPYAGWGWRVSAEINGRNEGQRAEFENADCGISTAEFDTKGTFIDVTAAALYIREDWWGLSFGGGLASYVVPGGDRVGFFGPQAVVGVFRVLPMLNLGLECSVGAVRLQAEDFILHDATSDDLSATWWYATPRLRLSIPFGRSRWLEGLRERVPIGNPRG